MVKAIFFDIDGTLLSFKTHKISPKTLESLHIARQKGIKLFIATGRHKAEVKNLAAFPFDGYVTVNGQYCYTPKQIIYKKAIDKRDIETLISILRSDSFTCIFLEEERVFFNRIDDNLIKLRETIKINDYPVLDPISALENEIFQVISFVSPEKENLIMEQLDHCDSTRWHPLFIDIIPKGGSKRIGLQKMLDFHGISREEIIAIGDGENDISMLEFAEVGIAMGNASDIVKSYADYITSSVDEEGVFNALKHFKII